MPGTSKPSCRSPDSPALRAVVAAIAATHAVNAIASDPALRLEGRLLAQKTESRIAARPAAPVELRLSAAMEQGRGATQPASAPAASSASRPEELVLEVDLNSQGVDKTLLVLRRPDGMFLMRGDDLAAYHLKTPSTQPYLHDSAPYFPIDSMPGARFAFDEIHQRLDVTVSPEAFEETLETAPGALPYPKPLVSSPGAFLNYVVDATHTSAASTVGGSVEAGLFSAQGVLTNGLLIPGSGDSTATERVVRLDTTFTRDLPDRHQTLRLGDTVSRAGAWGRSLHFGGVQWGTNFATEPGFATFPTHAVNGHAVVPSVVDVFVNNALVATREVRPGPFSISNIPFVTGSGNMRLVVRDLLNREQVVEVNQPFYSANTLLAPGLSDYSVEAGVGRDDFGIASNRYSEGFATGTWRHGFTDALTGEVRGEAERDLLAMGGSVTYLHSLAGVFELTGAASASHGTQGELIAVGYQRQGSTLSLLGRGQWSTPGFRQVGSSPLTPPPREQLVAGVGLQLGVLGSVNTFFARQRFRVLPGSDALSISYSRALGKWAYFSLTASRTRSVENGAAVSANVTVPLGANTSGSASYEASRSGDIATREAVLTMQKNRAADDNYSYRLQARSHDIEGVLDYRTNTNNFQVGLARVASQMAERAEVSGGIGYVGGHPFLSRLITGSFAVVKVADYPNVSVLFDNQLAGRTDRNGYFVFSDMRPYDRNGISVQQNDLPLDAAVARLRIDASPYFRSGVFIDFPVKRARSAVMHVVLEDGSVLPSGALVNVPGEADPFPAALKGEVFLSGLEDRTRVEVIWKAQSCRIELEYPKTDDALPELGTFVCKGVRP